MATRSTEQKLVDIIFEIGIVTREHSDYFNKISREEYADWIANQLRKNGFETTPRGLSWGVLS